MGASGIGTDLRLQDPVCMRSVATVHPYVVPAGTVQPAGNWQLRGNTSGVEKRALTEMGKFVVTLHVPVPLHAPPHPAKIYPGLGVAVRVTEVPGAKLPVQVPPQLMPAGTLVTVPRPLPILVTSIA